MTNFSTEQYGFLTGGIAPGRVQNLRGNSHLEAWDIRRHLIRAFGFDGFDIETKALDLVREIEIKPDSPSGKSRWTVVYRAEIRLTIKVGGHVVAVFEDAAAGDSSNQPSLGDAHDMAMKTAVSQGLKRCAVNLGDQFGLSLYNDGSTAPVVIRSLVTPDQPAGASDVAELGQADVVRPEQIQEVPVSAPPAVAPGPAPVAQPPEAPVSAPPVTPVSTEPAGREQLTMISDIQRKRIMVLFAEIGLTEPKRGDVADKAAFEAAKEDVRRKRLAWIDWALSQERGTCESSNDLTAGEADTVIEKLVARKARAA